MTKKLRWMVWLAFAGCAGLQKDCSSCSAENFGSDWLIVQYRNDGQVIKCWQLDETSVSNEAHSDGIFWKTPRGHLVHISGWYNRVQVERKDWEGAAQSLGVDLKSCSR